MELLGLLANFLIVIGLLLLPIYIARRIVPGPYRLAQRGLKRLGDFAVFNQVKRRGWIFAIMVHFAGLAGIAIVTAGMVTGTIGAVLTGSIYIAAAVTVALIYRHLRRVRRGRYLLPWRR